MKNKVIFTILNLLSISLAIHPQKPKYYIVSNLPHKFNSITSEDTFFIMLTSFISNKNNGYISYNSNGIIIKSWEKYYSNPKTIFPNYSIILKKTDSLENQKNNITHSLIISITKEKIDRKLYLIKRTNPELFNKIEALFLDEKYEHIEIKNQ